MAAPLRILLILLLGVLLLVGAAVGFLLTLDVENYRDDIVATVRESTGLDLRLQGPLELKLFPEFSLEVTDAAADWTDASKAPLAAIRRVHLAVPVLPLITGRGLQVESVVLDGVALDLRVDASGVDNWSPPGDAPAGGGDGADAPAAEPASVEADVSLELAVERLELTDLRVRYRDARDGTDVDLSGLSVVGTNVADGFAIDLGGRLDMKEGPRVAFDGDLVTDDELERVQIRALAADLELPDWAQPLPIRLSGEILRTDARIELKDLVLEAGELAARLGGSVDTGDTGTIALDVQITPSDLRAFLARASAAPATASPTALTELAGRLGLRGTSDDLRIDPLVVELDALTFAGTGRVRTGDRTFVAFDLDAGRLDLLPYLPPADEAAPEAATGPLVSDEPLGLDALAEIDVDGDLAASAIVLPGLEVGESRIEIDANAGRATVKLSVRDVLGGALAADVDLNVQPEVPTLGLRIDADAIDGGRFAPDAGISGAVSLDGRIDATGASTAALARSARGRLDFAGAPGTLDVSSLRAGLLPLAQLLGQGERIASWPDTLGYRNLSGAWILAEGTGDQRLSLALDNMKLDASGGIDLASGAFDFRSGAVFDTSTPRTFDVPRDLDGVRLPARCAGNLAEEGNPCGFDQQATGELVRQIAAGKAGQEIRDRLTERVPENLRGAADTLLRGLFGQPRQQPQQQPQPQQPSQTDPPR